MAGEKLPTIQGFSFSRYKNTSETTWQAAMDVALEKAREAQAMSENSQETSVATQLTISDI